jgi:transcription initiation factor TFIID subunit 1
LIFTVFVTNEPEESMDVDPNYDPSDFLLHGLPQQRAAQLAGQVSLHDKIHDDLEVSESDDEMSTATASVNETAKREPDDEDDGGELWF